VAEDIESPKPAFFSKTVPAAFKLDNTIGSLTEYEGAPGGELDRNFDPLTDIEGTRYAPFANDFILVRNRAQSDYVKGKIDRELEWRGITDSAGWQGTVASIGAGVFDPINLLPFGKAFGEARAITRVGATTGERMLRVGASTALSGGASVAAQELVLQGMQATRTPEESFINVGAGTFLAGLLGSAGAGIESAFLDNLAKRVDDELRTGGPDPVGATLDLNEGLRQRFEDDPADSAGAMRYLETTAKQERLISGGPVTTKGLTPQLRLSTSDFKEARIFSQKALRNPLYFEKYLDGIPAPESVEANTALWMGRHAYSLDKGYQLFKQYHARVKKEGGTPLDEQSFFDQVGLASRNMDSHEVPEVADVAKLYRKNVLDYGKDEAISVGELPEDITVDTAPSYLHRMYDRDTIVKHSDEFLKIVEDDFMEKLGEQRKSVEQGYRRQINNTLKSADEEEINLLRSEAAHLFDTVPADMTPEQVFDIVVTSMKRIEEPLTLTQFLKRRGGIKEYKNELFTLGITNKSHPGLISKKGKDLDEAGEALWEAGYFGPMAATERPTVAQVLEAIDDDVRSGGRRWTPEDASRYEAEADALDHALNFVEKHNIDPRRIIGRANELRKQNKAITILKEKAAEIEGELQEVLRRDYDEAGGTMREYARELAMDVYRTVAGVDASRQPIGLRLDAKGRGPLKQRVWNIADAKLDGSRGNRNFLINDIRAISGRYSRVMGADVELKRVFGTTDFETAFRPVLDEYQAKLAKAKTPAERGALTKKYQKSKRDAEAIWDLIRGQYHSRFTPDPDSNWLRAARLASVWNYMRLLGSQTVSSVGDAFGIVAKHGLRRTIGGVVRTMGRKLAPGQSLAKEARDDMLFMGAVIERVLNNRVMSVADIVDPYSMGTRFDRMLGSANRQFSRVTLMTWWNDTMKEIASDVAQKRLVQLSQQIAAGQKITNRADKLFFRSLSIGDDMAERIAAQFAKHGKVMRDGFHFAGVREWDDDGARRLFGQAVAKAANTTIITPGIGETPLAMNSPVGKLVMQFKTFMFAAHQNIYLPSMQQRNRYVVEALVGATAMGMMAGAFKEWNRGGDPSQWDVEKWVAEGLDQSGFASLFMEANNMAAKVNFPNIWMGIGEAPASRYESRGILESFVGPTAGAIQGMSNTAYAAMTPGTEFSYSDLHNIRKLLPYQNHFIFRQAIDEAEQSAADYLSLPRRR
jgi:hypothetical protein